MSKFRSYALAGCAMTALAACTQTAANRDVGTQKHREIVAKETTRFLELGGAQSGTLSTADKVKLDAFLGAYHDDGHGPLVVTSPQEAAGLAAVTVELQELLTAQGIPVQDQALGVYPAEGNVDAPIILAFAAYEAHVPGCSTVNEHDWSNMSSNVSLPSFGCAVNENIAMMIADPSDVLGQRELDPADAVRQGILLGKYRRGENTNSSATADGSSGG